MMKTLAVIAVAGLAAASANAALVTSRAALAGTDSINWGQFGPNFTPVVSGSAGLTNNGMPFTVHGPSRTLERRDQGTGWAGNFAPGDALMWTQNTPGAMGIFFAGNLYAVGAQIQRDSFGGFSGTIEVYDAGNVLLESYNVAGNSNSNGDNSAIFIGVRRAQGDINKVLFNVDGGSADFAVNQVDLDPIPTPGSLALLGAGGLLALRRRKRA